MTTSSPTPAPIVIETNEAADYLAQMDISLPDLQTALTHGEEAEGNTDNNHPVTAGGYYRWSETNASMRRSHVRTSQWIRENPLGRPLIKNKKASYTLTACGGNASTGTETTPNVSRKKGPATEAAHRGQSTGIQLSFALTLPGTSSQGADPLEADKPPAGEWLLLYFRDKEEMRAEVSLPAGFHEGFVTDWVVRVILPTTEMEERKQVPTDIGGGDVEFSITEA